MKTETIYNKISVVIPAKNEAEGLSGFLTDLKTQYPQFEIIVVNDASTDDTKIIAEQAQVKVITHPYSIGNGGSVKTGARHATREYILFMDGDGQHRVEDIEKLITRFNQGFDMVVGFREKSSQANFSRWVGNRFYNYIASIIVRQPILDLTSGFRIVKRELFMEFLHLLPNGFSYPSTITMAFFRSGYAVGYEKITVNPRKGKSHLRLFSDGLKFMLIIYKMTTLYSPFKVFLPFAALHFLAGILNYAYTFSTQGRFTNMSAVFLSASVIIFLIGLVSEQITALMYQRSNFSPQKPCTQNQDNSQNNSEQNAA
tara:strand:- start:88385 stop:89326 length:942 start_codon:yes stop_codon:yes gene_type:complete